MSEARNKKSAMATWFVFFVFMVGMTWFLMRTMDNTVSYIEALEDARNTISASVGE